MEKQSARLLQLASGARNIKKLESLRTGTVSESNIFEELDDDEIEQAIRDLGKEKMRLST